LKLILIETRCKEELVSQISTNSEVPRIFNGIQLIEASLNFNSKSILNLEKLKYGELFLRSKPSQPYFIFQV
jgi:hypothetical protein